jgi:hypothetical protein
MAGFEYLEGNREMKKLLLGCAIAALAAPAAYAQETTSSIRGTVTASGAPVANATVTIVHVPSGTRSVTTTNGDGSYSASGLRVGGPYTVTVSAQGYADSQVTDVNTLIAQAYELPIDLAGQGNEIVVTASRIKGARSVSQGPATVLNANQISKIASVNRDIRDLMRRDPFATLDLSQSTGRQVSFAGQNPRFNRFTIDGVPITDSFGLNPDALPSRRGPVPLDSIGQFETKVAPYDIREGFFQGGVVNAILKSGTNEFHGTGFYSYNSDKLTGDQTKPFGTATTADGHVIPAIPSFKSQDYGAEISGPIIKDKLFFMLSGERVRASKPLGLQVPGLTNVAAGPTNPVTQIQSIAKSVYNYEPGGIPSKDGDKDDRLVGKIDANLSDKQRLSLTGIYTKDSIISSTTVSSSVLGLDSNTYVKPDRVFAGIATLNSEWSSEFSTEARLLYKDYKSGQNPILGNTAQFAICTAPTSDRGSSGVPTTSTSLATACPTGTPTVQIGTGGPSQANILRIKTYGGSLLSRITLGDHRIKVLGEFQYVKNYDLFVNGSKGSYYFDSIADFQSGNAQSFSYTNAPSLDPNDAAARFNYQTYTFGIQDDWHVSSNLNVSYGARYDLFGGHDFPPINTDILARGEIPNNAFINGKGLLQPRIGFDYTPIPRLVIHGGGGIFGGGSPDVYVANSFSSNGVLSRSVSAQETDNGTYRLNSAATDLTTGQAILNHVNINSIPGLANNNLAGNKTTSVSLIDPHFKVPSQWRTTLSVTYDANLGPLGDHWVFGADGFYSKVRDEVFIKDIRSVPITGVGALTPDGRQRYMNITGINTDTNGDYELTNTSRGRSWVGVVHFDKAWDFGFDLNGSFTYQNVKDQQSLTSSIASSLYNNGAYSDPNGGAFGHSNDEVRYSFKYNASFDHAFFGDYKTRIDIFGETRIGSPYSYTFQDINSRGSAGNVFGAVGTNTRYLFYVPTGPNDPKAVYADAATQQAIENLINTTGLSKYRGKIAPRNGFNSKWFTKIDLHFEQEIPTFVGRSRFSVFADVENFTNLLNHKWGQQLRSFFPYNKSVVQVACRAVGGNPCGQYVYSKATPAGNITDQLISLPSLYSIRIGARLTF